MAKVLTRILVSLVAMDKYRKGFCCCGCILEPALTEMSTQMRCNQQSSLRTLAEVTVSVSKKTRGSRRKPNFHHNPNASAFHHFDTSVSRRKPPATGALLVGTSRCDKGLEGNDSRWVGLPPLHPLKSVSDASPGIFESLAARSMDIHTEFPCTTPSTNAVECFDSLFENPICSLPNAESDCTLPPMFMDCQRDLSLNILNGKMQNGRNDPHWEDDRSKPNNSTKALESTVLCAEDETINLCEPMAIASKAVSPLSGHNDTLQKRKRRTKMEILAQWESGDRRLLWRCEVCLKILHRNMKKKHPCVKRLKVSHGRLYFFCVRVIGKVGLRARIWVCLKILHRNMKKRPPSVKRLKVTFDGFYLFVCLFNLITANLSRNGEYDHIGMCIYNSARRLLDL